MSELSLQIIEPLNGSAFKDAELVPLRAALTGDASGLFFKWYSSLNAAATAAHPELNTSDHSVAVLMSIDAALPELGTHSLVLAASDRDGSDLASVQAVTRAALAGGAPPSPKPCLVHRVKAQIRTPAPGANLSIAGATLEVLAPVRWAKEQPPGSGTWLPDLDYQGLNGLSFGFRFTPAGPADPDHSADFGLDLVSAPFFRADGQTWLRWSGALSVQLVPGNYVFHLLVSASGVTSEATCPVVLTV